MFTFGLGLKPGLLGLGYRLRGLGFRVRGFRLRMRDLGLRVRGLGPSFKVSEAWIRDFELRIEGFFRARV